MPKRAHLLLGKYREHLVAADLLRRGFEVYEGDGRSSCDLVIRRGDSPFFGIEVKGQSGASGKTGTEQGLHGPVTWNAKDKNAARFDILAVVTEEEKIWYRRSVNHQWNPVTAELYAGNDEFDKMTTNSVKSRGKAIED